MNSAHPYCLETSTGRGEPQHAPGKYRRQEHAHYVHGLPQKRSVLGTMDSTLRRLEQAVRARRDNLPSRRHSLKPTGTQHYLGSTPPSTMRQCLKADGAKLTGDDGTLLADRCKVA